MTDVHQLSTLAAAQLEAARASSAGRAACTLHSGVARSLRQTLLAIVDGHALGEHDSPGDATLQVLTGRVRLSAGAEAWELRTGDLRSIPPTRHGLAALEDSVVLLTVVAGTPNERP